MLTSQRHRSLSSDSNDTVAKLEEHAVVLLSGADNHNMPNAESLSPTNLTTSTSMSSPFYNKTSTNSQSSSSVIYMTGVVQLLGVLTCVTGSLVTIFTDHQLAFVYSFAAFGAALGIVTVILYRKREHVSTESNRISLTMFDVIKSCVDKNSDIPSNRVALSNTSDQRREANVNSMTSLEPCRSRISDGSQSSVYANLRQKEHARRYWTKKRAENLDGCKNECEEIGKDVDDEQTKNASPAIISCNMKDFPVLRYSTINDYSDIVRRCSYDDSCRRNSERSDSLSQRSVCSDDVGSSPGNERRFPLLNTPVLSSLCLNDDYMTTQSSCPPYSSFSCFNPKFNSPNSSYEAESTSSARLKDFDDDHRNKSVDQSNDEIISNRLSCVSVDELQTLDVHIQPACSPCCSAHGVYLFPRIMKHNKREKTNKMQLEPSFQNDSRLDYFRKDYGMCVENVGDLQEDDLNRRSSDRQIQRNAKDVSIPGFFKNENVIGSSAIMACPFHNRIHRDDRQRSGNAFDKHDHPALTQKTSSVRHHNKDCNCNSSRLPTVTLE